MKVNITITDGDVNCTDEDNTEGPYIKGPYIKGPSLVIPRPDGTETAIDIDKLVALVEEKND